MRRTASIESNTDGGATVSGGIYKELQMARRRSQEATLVRWELKKAALYAERERLRLNGVKTNLHAQIQALRLSRNATEDDGLMTNGRSAVEEGPKTVTTGVQTLRAFNNSLSSKLSRSQPALAVQSPKYLRQMQAISEEQQQTLSESNGLVVMSERMGVSQAKYNGSERNIVITTNNNNNNNILINNNNDSGKPYASLQHLSNGHQQHHLKVDETTGDNHKVSIFPVPHSASTHARLDGLSVFQEEDIVYDERGFVLGGTRAALLKRLVPRASADYCPDSRFIFTMLLNIRAFVPVDDVLQQMLQQCLFEQHTTSDNFRKDVRTRLFTNVLQLCQIWTKDFPYDFRPVYMQKRLAQLLSLSSADSVNKRKAESLLEQLQAVLNKLDRYERALNKLTTEASPSLEHSDTPVGLVAISEQPTTVAHQLTHIELERLSMIGPEEFLTNSLGNTGSPLEDKAATALFSPSVTSNDSVANGSISGRSPTTSSSLCSGSPPTLNGHAMTNGSHRLDERYEKNHYDASHDREPVKNISHYITWFNRVTYLVGGEICRHSKKRDRIRTVQFFIDVAKECFDIGNFNSLMAIIAGLGLAPVARLKKTWARVDTSKLDILQHQLDPSGNFSSYRATLKAAVWRCEGATRQSERIVVPFFTLFAKDTVLLQQRCAKTLPNGHLNFAMFSQFADTMSEFVRWKNSQCPFKKDAAVLHYLLTADVYTDNELMILSCMCEPPETASEREQFKQLSRRQRSIAEKKSSR